MRIQVEELDQDVFMLLVRWKKDGVNYARLVDPNFLRDVMGIGPGIHEVRPGGEADIPEGDKS